MHLLIVEQWWPAGQNETVLALQPPETLHVYRLLTQKLDVNWKDVIIKKQEAGKQKPKDSFWKDRLMKNWVEGPVKNLWLELDSSIMQHAASAYRAITVVLQMLIFVISIRQLMMIIGDCTWFSGIIKNAFAMKVTY